MADSDGMGLTSLPSPLHLILLHGWGASGDDLLPVGQELTRALGLSDGAVTLRALEAPDVHPAGGGARQWYDLNTPGWPGIPEAVADLAFGWIRNWRQLVMNQWWFWVFPRGRPWP